MSIQRDLVVGLELDTRDFSNGADRATGRLRRFENDARSFGNSSSRSFNKASRGLLELSRGAEDFAVSFGTGGLAGGFRGAANNISQFASMIHPLAGALAGLGVAAASAWLSYNKGASDALSKTKKLEAESKRVAESLRKLREKQDFNIRLKVAGGKIDEFGAAQERFNNARGTAGDVGSQLQSVRDQLAKERAALEAARGPDGSRKRIAEVFDPTAFGTRKETIAGLQEQEKQLEQRFSEALKKAEEARRPLAIAEAKRNRESAGGELEGIRLQKEDFRKSLEARRQAAEQRRQTFRDNLRESDRLQQGRGDYFGLSAAPTAKPQNNSAPGLASIAQRGSAAAARAIAEAKNQASTQKAQLEVQRQMLAELEKASKEAQAENIIESFGTGTMIA